MDITAPLTGPVGLAARLAPSIRAVSDEIEDLYDLPSTLVAALREAGAFSLLTPRELGGFEAPLTTALQVYEEFGRLDASVAWVVWNANFGFMGALLGDAGIRQIWPADRPGPVFANSGSPGTAVPVDGGYLVSGNWKIVSGVDAADWVVVIAVISEGAAPRLTEGGQPDVRLFAVPASQVTIKKTWHVSGMRGSGSNDVVIDDAFVAAELVGRFDVPPRIDRPLYRGFLPALVLAGCTAIVVGVAAAAIDDTVRLALTKKSVTGEAMAERPRVQSVIAASEADLDAARLLLLSAARSLQDAGEAGVAVTAEQRAALRAAMSHAARVSRRVLVDMYELASSSPLYTGDALERRFRDGMAALQHVNHSAAAFEAAGRVRLGLAPNMALF
ncbi:MAG TPA: acyl-CoA dehydrogenase family protein [Trebonia sp.]